MSFKKANCEEGLPKEAQKAQKSLNKADKAQISGVNCGLARQTVLERIPGDCEYVIHNKDKYQNSAIVFGRDRPRGISAGYGGRGDTQADMIDIVVGLQGSSICQIADDPMGQFIDPDFAKDAARIYISQKTDVDKNFVLAPGSLGSPGLESATKSPRSAIALKADDIRIIGREGIKLVTGTDTKNSQGGKVLSVGGIDLIAGNENRAGALQPLVLGNNMVDAMFRLVHHMNKLSGIVDAFCTHQKSFNEVLIGHTHIGFQAQPTWPSLPVQAVGKSVAVDLQTQVLTAITLFKSNLGNFESSYLYPMGEKYINSRFNNSN